ncbi:MAG: aminoacyl-tRNA hydrolase [Dongiaceae bacterium]
MEGAGKPAAGVVALGRLGTKVLKAWREGRILKAIGWRLLRLVPFYRVLLLRRVTFIGITGSCGKTTAKELAAAVLATRFKGRANPASYNAPPHLDRTILRVRPWDAFCLLELSPTKMGKLVFDHVLRMVRPQIGVMTVIGTDHIRTYRSIEAIAAEKSKLIAALPVHGTAILNFDDPHVRSMRSLCAGRVISYGQTPEAMLRAEDIRASWPDGLSFTIRYEEQSHLVRTQLYGSHLVPCVLAALAVGVAMGVPLHAAVDAVGTVPPFGRRMRPVDHPDGFTVIRDDYKAPLWSIPAALQFVKEARAQRKVVVIGTISDTTGTSEAAYVSTARQALQIADCVLFVGRNSSKCLKAKRNPRDEAVQAFYSVEAAARHLRGWLRRGDLVLLKGSEVDNLDAIVAASLLPQDSVTAESVDVAGLDSADRPLVVVGLGNPGDAYEETPHNAGYRALDMLARSLGAEWTQEEDATIARIGNGGRTVYLLKPLTAMNVTGPALLRIGRRVGFGPADCILVHDDADLPLGSVRVRMRAGDAGHRGVRSVLDAFQTDEVRRVRIGVGRPGRGRQVKEDVLTAWSPAERATVERAGTEAARQVVKLLGLPDESARATAMDIV